ncbi:hypothetical protein CHS0354_033974 [Potamilus streckersoni]|uniref:Uncharacterized protein n=1 Tax=Potamilus streckersoni TaxID=2493646 RepID=A0AAE0T8G5_9BIVA|nr:hypothetical protein CHS0354_033974 [Potamilus streckersoni]
MGFGNTLANSDVFANSASSDNATAFNNLTLKNGVIFETPENNVDFLPGSFMQFIILLLLVGFGHLWFLGPSQP